MMQRILFGGLFLLSLGAQAQNVLTGRVLDSLTHEPIPYVNVFFANTTIGSVTDSNGEFNIHDFPSGKYDLTASFVGYSTIQFPIEFSNGIKNIIIHLSQQVIQLQGVFVNEDTLGRKNNLDQFKQHFVGSTKNASQSMIINPRNIRLYFDPKDRLLLAFAKKPVEIENRALGYKIHYQLIDFKFDYSQGRIEYLGIPRFERLAFKNKHEAKRWEKERKRAYSGSFMHFVRILKQNSLSENGFEVHTLYRVKNRNRPNDEYLNERIRFWKEKQTKENGYIMIGGSGKNDSLTYYFKKRSLPKVVDSLGRKITNSRELFAPGSVDVIQFTGMLRVTYKNESEEVNYRPGKHRLKVQQSVIHFLGPQLRIYANGYYEDVRDVFFEGYMGWSEKMAELLPLEYAPGD